MNSVLSCFFPTTVVLVDDNPAFLESLQESLDVKNVSLITFSDPSKALEYINDVSSINRLDYVDLTRSGEEDTSDWKSILINVNCLHHEIYSFNRFSMISAVVSDYFMNGMNGIELCADIENKSIRKILLTGMADEKCAIDAFNNNFIDCFVKKDSSDFSNEIRENVQKGIHQYFANYSENISRYLSVHGKTHLKDPVFANFFNKLCNSVNFCEYYMLDGLGSYLFLDEQGKTSFLCVITEYEMDKLIETARESGEMDDETLASLESKEVMLAYHNRRGTLPPISEWKKYLVPARVLSGYQTYYFAMVDPSFLDIDTENIKTFKQYKKSSGF